MVGRGSIQLWGRGFDCSVGFWVGDGRSGTQFSGGGRPTWVQPRVPVSHGRQARGPRQRASLPPVFQFSRPTRRGGWVFSRCRRWVKGNLRRERRGEVSKGLTARGFWQGSYMRGVPPKVVDLPSPGWSGREHGTRKNEEMATFACAATCLPPYGRG